MNEIPSANLTELFTKIEPICDELRPFLKRGSFGECLHHPLMIEMFLIPDRCALINHRYKYKKEAVERALQEGKWSAYIGLHERPYRVEALSRAIHSGLNENNGLHEAVAYVWTDSENIWQNKDFWFNFWENLPNPQNVMDEDELKFFNDLPESIEVYRGAVYKQNTQGISWTLDREKAIWFANRFRQSKKAVLVTGKVHKKDVLAYFSGRGEQEVVVLPAKVKSKKITHLS
jgi:hypothetical protein